MKNHTYKRCGWTVIRFAEEQIIKYPNYCIEFIKNVLKEHECRLSNSEEKIKTRITKLPDDFYIKRWTKGEAFQLAYKRHRQKYLPDEFHKNLLNEG